jgi:septum formation topological specificity factor MinE
MTLAELTSKRLEGVLTRDKKQNPKQILAPLKSDLYALLENYLDIKNLNIEIEATTNGFVFSASANAKSIKNIGIMA